MAGVLDSVDSRTQLVGENRLELLMFRLRGRQLFAINVFKVREVVRLPKLTSMPNRHPFIVGVTHLRGQTIPVINLSQAIGMPPLKPDEHCNVIVTEYNSSVQAFLVGGVERIVNLTWESIQPPPQGAGRAHYLTAITRLDDQIVEVVDVEKVLAEVSPYTCSISESVLDAELVERARGMEVLIVDDSNTGLSQARDTVQRLGIKVHAATDGRKGLALLKQWADAGEDVPQKLLMVITDAEMPEMDGYRLTREIREDPRLRGLYVVLHTSLSGNFNKAMVQKVGCDDFLSKFHADQLATTVQNRIRDIV